MRKTFGVTGLVCALSGNIAGCLQLETDDDAVSMDSTASDHQNNYLSAECFPNRVGWEPVPEAAAPADCVGCGIPVCEMYAIFTRYVDDLSNCPPQLYEELSNVERETYEAGRFVKMMDSVNGEILQKQVFCPVPKSAAPLNCALTQDRMQNSNKLGWYYCEEAGENFLDACGDAVDNDGDGRIDDEDEDCAACVAGTAECDSFKCAYNVQLTERAQSVTLGRPLEIWCEP